MNKQLMSLAAGMVAVAASLPSQTTTQPTRTPAQISGFQQAEVMGTMGSVAVRAGGGGRGGAVVTGSPLSAKQVSKTVQTLGDGTQLENGSTNLYYRDNLGRTRNEPQDGSPITISDPVGGFTLRLNTGTKTAVRSTTAVGGGGGFAGGRGGGGVVVPGSPVDAAAAADQLKKQLIELEAVRTAQAAGATPRLAVRQSDRPQPNVEDLGTHLVNGVMAQGTRTTTVIPQGQIGNNREIRVVNERWYSKELQMMVKTVNSDPRFGVTTYELNDIVTANPDAALFQAPPSYAVEEMAGRGGGGRGGAVAK